MSDVTSRVLVCRGPECAEGRGEGLYRLFEKALASHGLAGIVRLLEYSCFGHCDEGPNVVIGPSREGSDFLFELFGEAQYFAGKAGECLYSGISEDDVETLVVEHLIHGRPVARFLSRGTP